MLYKLSPSLPVAQPSTKNSAIIQQTLSRLNAVGMQILSIFLGSQWLVNCLLPITVFSSLLLQEDLSGIQFEIPLLPQLRLLRFSGCQGFLINCCLSKLLPVKSVTVHAWALVDSDHLVWSHQGCLPGIWEKHTHMLPCQKQSYCCRLTSQETACGLTSCWTTTLPP